MSSIRETAERIAYKYLDRTFGSAKLQADIERALRNERERAAKIAENSPPTIRPGSDEPTAFDDGQRFGARLIAAAIRKDD